MSSLTPFDAFEALEKIARETGVSIDWLLLGQGAMWHNARGHGESRESQTEYRADHREFLNLDGFVLVPRYDVTASAGSGALVASEQVVDHLAFKCAWVAGMGLTPDKLALISARGDSMEPTIRDGYLLLVDLRQQHVGGDGIYIIRINNELIAKRLQRQLTGGIKVISDNSAYQGQVVPADQVDNLNIIGRVVWGGGRM